MFGVRLKRLPDTNTRLSGVNDGRDSVHCPAKVLSSPKRVSQEVQMRRFFQSTDVERDNVEALDLAASWGICVFIGREKVTLNPIDVSK